MRPIAVLLLTGVLLSAASARAADQIETHKVYLPQDLKWTTASPALPAGAEMALLFGDPQKSGMFALRVKLPKGYRIAPHTHRQSEMLTVMSGRLSLGLGPAADRNSLEQLPAGSFSSMPHGVVHYVLVDEPSVIEIEANGPSDIEYADPKDDPRLNVAPAAAKSELSSSRPH